MVEDFCTNSNTKGDIMIEKYNKTHENRVKDLWDKSSSETNGFLSEDFLDMAETFVFTEGGEAIGFVAVIDRDFLIALSVSEGNRGRGVGRQLLEHCMTEYKSIDASVYSKNTGAVAFFEKCGMYKKYETEDEDTGEKVTAFGWIGLLEKYKDIEE